MNIFDYVMVVCRVSSQRECHGCDIFIRIFSHDGVACTARIAGCVSVLLSC